MPIRFATGGRSSRSQPVAWDVHDRDGLADSRGPGPAEHQQIISDDTEPDPTLHPALAAVSAAPQTMTALERTDPSFTARSPAEGQAGNSRAGCARLARKHDVPDSALVPEAFIHCRGKAAISDGELG